jgi:EAL domain-containing protein (putative c-di-GMP-specific phosphodiesterase class I)
VVVEYLANGQDTDAAEFYEKLEYAAVRAYSQKHRYIRYTDDMGADMVRARYLRERLRTVDRAHGYEVWFQPVQCLSTGEFCSMEALIRLREPDGTLVSPAEFIPLAEQEGSIAPITWFVLEETCAFLKANPQLNGVSVSVNLPMPQLLEKGFAARLAAVVDGAGIAHRRICLEFTERAILENFEHTKIVMEQLTADGFRFFLDDFGTGYSNFNCLLQLPFQIIKLDACLVRPAADGREDYAMVRTLTDLFHGMELEVIAEGAETAAEVEALKVRGVDRIQGFALARPMPQDTLTAFFVEHPVAPR